MIKSLLALFMSIIHHLLKLPIALDRLKATTQALFLEFPALPVCGR
ncbi:MAG: hypothetical protein HQM00_15805 [Magnetococcales bacterium]|nr:hypothetical protein [Magnetococcales bacterium]